MMYFKEKGKSYQEVMNKIRTKYGSSAHVTNYETLETAGFLGLFSKEFVELSGYVKTQSQIAVMERTRDEDEARKILQQIAAQKKVGSSDGAPAEPREIKEKRDQTETLKNALVEEMKTFKEELKSELSKHNTANAPRFEHPHLTKLEELLHENDFSRNYIQAMMDRFKKEFPLGDLEDWNLVSETLMNWIEETILIQPDSATEPGHVFTLVGPTGIGKTTTLAKLAGLYRMGKLGEKNKNLVLITIDNYRIGAKAQFETYGGILEVPVYAVETADLLRQKILYHSEASVFLVDTVGKSPKDFLQLAEMRTVLEGCGKRAEIHLAISSTTKTRDIQEIIQQFEPFGYKSVVLTKMDETTQVGNIISILWDKKKSISYITDGQVVPQDIHRATKDKIMQNLIGFPVQRSNHG